MFWVHEISEESRVLVHLGDCPKAGDAYEPKSGPPWHGPFATAIEAIAESQRLARRDERGWWSGLCPLCQVRLAE